MPLHVTDRDLINSYVRLRRAAEATAGATSHLLRFYSVECGLKAMALKRRKLRTTAQLPEDLRSHDLRRLAEDDLRLSPKVYKDLVACRRVASGPVAGSQVNVRQWHEAWRYGAALDPQDEKRSVAVLTALGQRCREELRR